MVRAAHPAPDPLGRAWHSGEFDDGYIAPTYVPVVPPLIFAVTDPPIGGVITYDIYDLRAPAYAAGIATAFTLVSFGIGSVAGVAGLAGF